MEALLIRIEEGEFDEEHLEEDGNKCHDDGEKDQGEDGEEDEDKDAEEDEGEDAGEAGDTIAAQTGYLRWHAQTAADEHHHAHTAADEHHHAQTASDGQHL